MVHKLDRLGRSWRDLMALLGEWEDAGISPVSVAESFDSATPEGRMQRHVLAGFAELEADVVAERLRAGRAARARAGAWPGGVPPYGYRLEERGAHTVVVVDDAEAEALVLGISSVVEKGLTTGEAADELNARGLRPRRAGAWSGAVLRRALRGADAISGTYLWRPGNGASLIAMAIPPIISPEAHAALRAHLARTSRPHIPHPGAYLLSGRMTSPCGGPMWGATTASANYRCRHSYPASTPRCSYATVGVAVTEDAVWEAVIGLLGDPACLLALASLEPAPSSDAGAAEAALKALEADARPWRPTSTPWREAAARRWQTR